MKDNGGESSVLIIRYAGTTVTAVLAVIFFLTPANVASMGFTIEFVMDVAAVEAVVLKVWC